MLVTFKRDKDGRESVHADGREVALLRRGSEFDLLDDKLDRDFINDAIECANGAGFWNTGLPYPGALFLRDEVTIWLAED